MTLCPSGSAPKSTAPAYAWITWVEAHSFLGLAWPIFTWIAELLKPVLVEISTFCATEPPQPVYPGDATVVAAATDPVAFEQILQYLKDSATWWVWSQNCECNASSSPSCFAPLFSHASNMTSNTTQTNRFFGIEFIPNNSLYTCWGLDFDSASSQSIDIFYREIATGPLEFTTKAVVNGWNRLYFNAGLPLLSGHTYEVGVRGNPPSGNWTHYYQAGTLPSFGGGWTAGWMFGPGDMSTNSPAGVNNIGIDPVVCVASPAAYTPAAPPVPVTSLPDVPTLACSTTGDLCAIVQPQVNANALLLQRLDLLQRRLLPFAWILGSPSTGLTGAGSITVQDAIGCIVDLTTVPAGWGASTDTPRRLYPAAGIVQGASASKVDDGRWVRYEHEVLLWNDPWATSLTYNFKPGVVGTVTPILPEP